jgi:hypothetical protein
MQFYFGEMVELITPYTQNDLVEGELAVKADAYSMMHDYFDLDWIRAVPDPMWIGTRYGDTFRNRCGDRYIRVV